MNEEMRNAIIFLIVIFIIGWFISDSYDIPQEEENYEDVEDSFPNTSELHWGHMPMTYNYDAKCLTIFQGKMRIDIENAMLFISDRTDNAITFQKTNSLEPDILFICDIGGIRRGGFKPGFETIAEAEPWIYEELNLFTNSKIYIYGTYECLGNRPILLIHEILHLVGLEHNVNPSHTGDIMHPYLSDDCNADILEKDIDYLKNIYKQ